MRLPARAHFSNKAHRAGRCGSRAVPVTRPGPDARLQQQSQRTLPPWQYLLYPQGVPPERAIFPGCNRTPRSRSQDKAARMWPAPKIMRATPAPAGYPHPGRHAGRAETGRGRMGRLAEHFTVADYSSGHRAGKNGRRLCVTRAGRCDVFQRPVPAQRMGAGGAALSRRHLGSGCHRELSTKLRGRLPDRPQDNKRSRR